MRFLLRGSLALSVALMCGSCMEVGTKDVYPIAISDTERSLASWVSSDLAPRSRTTPTRADEARRQLVDNHPEWPEDARQAILNGEVLPGMTRPQAMSACGIFFMRKLRYRPYRELWYYDRDPLIVVLYFLDDTLVGAKGFDEHNNIVGLPDGRIGIAVPHPPDTMLEYESKIHRVIFEYPEWDGSLPVS